MAMKKMTKTVEKQIENAIRKSMACWTDVTVGLQHLPSYLIFIIDDNKANITDAVLGEAMAVKDSINQIYGSRVDIAHLCVKVHPSKAYPVINIIIERKERKREA